MKPSQERRSYTRKRCLISIDWSVSENVFTSTIRDISHGGMFIETSDVFELGQQLSLKILAPEKIKKINNLSARVIRIEPDGIAVEFEKEDQKQFEMIQFFVENA